MTVPAKFSLFRRNNGIYYICYRDGSRKRWKSTACRTKADALRAITQLHSLLKTKPTQATLSQFATQYVSHAEAFAEPTHHQWQKAVAEGLETGLSRGRALSHENGIDAALSLDCGDVPLYLASMFFHRPEFFASRESAACLFALPLHRVVFGHTAHPIAPIQHKQKVKSIQRENT
jgi:hypothetical protein